MATGSSGNKKRDPPGFVVNDVVDYPQFYGMTNNRSLKSKSYHHPRRDHRHNYDDEDDWHNSFSSFHSSSSSEVPLVVVVEKDHSDSLVPDSSTHSSPPSNGRNRRMMNNKGLNRSWHGPRRSGSRGRRMTTRHEDEEDIDDVFEIGCDNDRYRVLHRSQSRSRR